METQKDGYSQVMIGVTRSGKSTLTIHETENHPFVFYVMTNITNPYFKILPFIMNTEIDLQKIPNILKEGKIKRLVILTGETPNPRLFKYLETYGPFRTVVLDDIATYTDDPQMNEAFVSFIRKVGWSHIELYMSTHRMLGDIAPSARSCIRKITWVGRLNDEGEATKLWSMRDTGIPEDKKAFHARLQALKSYDYKTRNKEESCIIVKEDPRT